MSVRPKTRPVVATVALLLGTFLASLDVNVVGTSLPTVVSKLGGLSLYGWVFAAYLLTSTTTVPLYGRMADLYGRKPMFIAAAVLFMVGSFLCGLAPTMVWLIAFRALQGLGAGGVVPLTLTVFGDLYTAEKRALVQGVFSVVWGVSSVLGPLAGGFLVTYASWQWVFWINIPLGVLSVLLLSLSLFEEVDRDARDGSLNLGGAALLVGGLSALLAGFQHLGDNGLGATGLVLLGAGAAVLLLFVALERRSAAPMFPAQIFGHRAARVTYVAGLGIGGILFPLGAYVPLHIQGVLHGSPTQAGLALVPMSLSWTVLTFVTGRLAARLGYRPVVLIGGALLLLGGAAMVGLSGSSSVWALHPAMLLLGGGMGLTITPLTIAVQDIMAWNRRAMATAMMQFTRTVGGTVAVTLLGILISARFAAALPQSADAPRPAELLDPSRWDALPGDLLQRATDALAGGTAAAFAALAGLGLCVLLIFFAFPRLEMDRSRDAG